MSRKLEEIAALRAGWWGSESQPVPPDLIKMVEALIPTLARHHAHIAIAPHASGALLLEWTSGQIEYTVELLPRHGGMVLIVDDSERDDYFEDLVRTDIEELRTFVQES